MKTKNNTMRYFISGSFGLLFLIGIDQWTKYLAIQYLANHEDVVLIPKVLSLHYLENRGAAFGILQNQQWIFIAMASFFFLAATVVYFKLPRTRHYLFLHMIAVGITSGAVGNVIDRIRLGYVVDFVYFSLIDFPVFNMADVYVVISAILLFLLFVFYYKEEDFDFLKKREKKQC